MRNCFPVLLLFTAIASCNEAASPADAPESAQAVTHGAIPSNTKWLNVDYADCVAEKCPCECMTENTISMMELDSVNGKSCAYIYRHNAGHDLWYLTAHADGSRTGAPADSLKNNARIKLYMNAGWLQLEEGGVRTTNLTAYDEFESFGGAEYFALLNAKLLRERINLTDTLIRSLLALDSTTVVCDSALGNVLYAPAMEQHKTWLLQLHGDSIWLYQDNKCVGKFPRL